MVSNKQHKNVVLGLPHRVKLQQCQGSAIHY